MVSRHYAIRKILETEPHGKDTGGKIGVEEEEDAVHRLMNLIMDGQMLAPTA